MTSDLEQRVVSQGCYSPEENRRIYDKWFSGTRPRDRLIAWLEKRFALSGKRLCDVGCAYGMHVLRGGPGSFGIEIEDYEVEFARSVGVQVHRRDLLTEDLSDLPTAEVVMALAIIEHVDSPHVLLRKLHGLLEPGGLLFLETPRRPPSPILEHLPVVGRAYQEHDDHINSFTPATLSFFCERAGFEVVWHRLWSKPLVNSYGVPPWLSGIFPFSLVANGVVLAARKIEPWDYGRKSTRRAATNELGYRPVGQQFPELPTRVANQA